MQAVCSPRSSVRGTLAVMSHGLSRWAVRVVLGGVLALPGVARAQQAAPATSSEAVSSQAAPSEAPSGDGTTKKEPPPPSITGGYSWKDPPKRRAAARVKRDPNAPLVSFPTFRMLPDGRSQLTVLVSKKTSIEQRVAAGRLSFLLRGAEVVGHIATLPLVVVHFDTPATRARLQRTKQGVELVIELREAARLQQTTADGPGGSMLVTVELPKAQRTYTDEVARRFHGTKRRARVERSRPLQAPTSSRRSLR